jgi:hypothetical protein
MITNEKKRRRLETQDRKISESTAENKQPHDTQPGSKECKQAVTGG